MGHSVGRKGEGTTSQLIFITIGLVLAAVVAVSFMGKVVDDARGVTLEKNYIARDIALALDAIYAAPGDVEYTYSMKDYRFVVEIKNGAVFVKGSEDEPEAKAGIYDFFGDGGKKLKACFVPHATGGSPPVEIMFNKKQGEVGYLPVAGVELKETCQAA